MQRQLARADHHGVRDAVEGSLAGGADEDEECVQDDQGVEEIGDAADERRTGADGESFVRDDGDAEPSLAERLSVDRFRDGKVEDRDDGNGGEEEGQGRTDSDQGQRSRFQQVRGRLYDQRIESTE